MANDVVFAAYFRAPRRRLFVLQVELMKLFGQYF